MTITLKNKCIITITLKSSRYIFEQRYLIQGQGAIQCPGLLQGNFEEDESMMICLVGKNKKTTIFSFALGRETPLA